MSTLSLSQRETEVLREVIRSYLRGLQDEIAHTDSHDFREELKETRAIVEGLLDRVSTVQR